MAEVCVVLHYWYDIFGKAFWDCLAFFDQNPRLLLIGLVGAVVTAILVRVFRGKDAFMEHIKANLFIAFGGGIITWLLFFPYFLLRAPAGLFFDSQAMLDNCRERGRSAVIAKEAAELQLMERANETRSPQNTVSGHWTQAGIRPGYLLAPQTKTGPTFEYTQPIYYTGETTFQPVSIRLTFNQRIDDGLFAKDGNDKWEVSGKTGSIPPMAGASPEASYVGDLQSKIIGHNMLEVRFSSPAMNKSDCLDLFFRTTKNLGDQLSVVKVEKRE